MVDIEAAEVETEVEIAVGGSVSEHQVFDKADNYRWIERMRSQEWQS